MPVDTTHPQYDTFAPIWARLRDAITGEDAIKEKGADYLPVPPSVDQTKGEQSAEYINYKSRARFPEAVGPAVEAMVGLMSREGLEVELPNSLERLRERATPDGMTLEDLINRIRHEVVAVGRYILLVDAPQEGGDPYIATYNAESLINWRSDGDRITLAVFQETVPMPRTDDPFVEDPVEQWREASVEVSESGQEQYVQRIWRRGAENVPEIVDEVVPTQQGRPLDFVPAVIIGSRDLLPDPDAVPLLPVVNKALHYYRQYADYALQLFMSANGTTPYAIGVDPEEAPREIGPATIWAFSNPEAKVGYIEVGGAGVDAQKQSLDELTREIADAAMRVLGEGRRAAEAAEALRLRFQSQTATLSTIAHSTGMGIERTLKHLAQWSGVDPEQVQVTVPTEFIREQPDGQLLQAIMQGVERGLMPEDILAGYTRRTRLHDMSDEEFRRLSPSAMALPSEDQGQTGTEFE